MKRINNAYTELDCTLTDEKITLHLFQTHEKMLMCVILLFYNDQSGC
jgi:hypothetical protein